MSNLIDTELIISIMKYVQKITTIRQQILSVEMCLRNAEETDGQKKFN